MSWSRPVSPGKTFILGDYAACNLHLMITFGASTENSRFGTSEFIRRPEFWFNTDLQLIFALFKGIVHVLLNILTCFLIMS